MDALLSEFKSAYRLEDGIKLAAVFNPASSSDSQSALRQNVLNVNHATIESDVRSALIYHNDLRLSKEESNAWKDVFLAYVATVREFVEASHQAKGKDLDWLKPYKSWWKLSDIVTREFHSSKFPYWAVPLLPTVAAYLRTLAKRADDAALQKAGGVTFNEGLEDDLVASNKKANLEDAARLANRMFAACLSDRSPIEESRKWGIYAVANLLFKIYFNLNALNLAKNVINSINVQTDIPPLNQYPKAHQVTWNYYNGVITFLAEDYETAENYLQQAWENCHPSSKKNQELILTYLIPCHILTTHQLPSASLLAPFPALNALFRPLCRAIRSASLSGFDAALAAHEAAFVRRRIYLTLERTRDLVLRNVMRNVFLAGGREKAKDVGGPVSAASSSSAPAAAAASASASVRRTRIPVDECMLGVRISLGQKVDRDEVECFLANLIYKGYIKGYISRGASMIVLSKSNPFPGTKIPA